jgi:hypothetical protein
VKTGKRGSAALREKVGLDKDWIPDQSTPDYSMDPSLRWDDNVEGPAVRDDKDGGRGWRYASWKGGRVEKP